MHGSRAANGRGCAICRSGCCCAPIRRSDPGEAAEPDPYAYRSFNAFFTRALRPGARPVAPGADALVSPVDGTVSQFGDAACGRLMQAKGREYTAARCSVDSAAGRGLCGRRASRAFTSRRTTTTASTCLRCARCARTLVHARPAVQRKCGDGAHGPRPVRSQRARRLRVRHAPRPARTRHGRCLVRRQHRDRARPAKSNPPAARGGGRREVVAGRGLEFRPRGESSGASTWARRSCCSAACGGRVRTGPRGRVCGCAWASCSPARRHRRERAEWRPTADYRDAAAAGGAAAPGTRLLRRDRRTRGRDADPGPRGRHRRAPRIAGGAPCRRRRPRVSAHFARICDEAAAARRGAGHLPDLRMSSAKANAAEGTTPNSR